MNKYNLLLITSILLFFAACAPKNNKNEDSEPADEHICVAVAELEENLTEIKLKTINSYESPFYGIGFATATSPQGIWTKYEYNPIYQNVGELVGIGHSAMFTNKEGKLGKSCIIDPDYITPQLKIK